MSKLCKLKKNFENGEIQKQEFIERMHEVHVSLFHYAEYIKNTEIEKIEIHDDFILMSTRKRKVKLLCDKQDLRIIPIEILNFGSYEEQEADVIAELIEPNYNIFDIGANIGWYSINFAKMFDSLNIYAFEPIPKTFDYLNKNISLNDIKNIKTFNFGFSNFNGEIDFYYYPECSGNASLADLTNSQGTEKLYCNVRKLDDFISDNEIKIDFIKCDVEGAELLVFEGAIETFRAQKPIVFTEMLRKWSQKFNYHPNDIIKLFESIGYGCFIVKKNNKIERFYEMSNDTSETNFIFLHLEKHSGKIIKMLNED